MATASAAGRRTAAAMATGAYAVLLSATVATADPLPRADAVDPWMGDAEIDATFRGKTIQGHYVDGNGFTEAYRPDGSIDYQERSVSHGGQWSVVGGAFCTIYTTLATGGCYRVRRVSDNCYEFFFAARSERDAADGRLSRRPSLTARAAVADRVSTCDERPAV
jgi:hypothetical protein